MRWLNRAVTIGLLGTWALSAAASIRGQQPNAATTRREQSPSQPEVLRRPGMGAVVGRVTYVADTKRPWRLGRYYLGSRGQLSEAVVALHRRGLTGPQAERPSETVTVDQKNFQFIPETVAIRVGDRVQYLNSDRQNHNVRTPHPRHEFNVTLPPGGKHVETFPAAGGIRQPFRVGCAFHSAMRSWVFVFDHPWFHVTGADGVVQLWNVPPGEYRLEVFHPAGELRLRRTVVVKADQTLAVDVQLSPDDLAR